MALLHMLLLDTFFSTSFINIHIICTGKKIEKKGGFIVIMKFKSISPSVPSASLITKVPASPPLSPGNPSALVNYYTLLLS